MQRPEITGWGITTNENGVKIASINRDNLVEIIEYVEYLEKQLQFQKQSLQVAVRNSLPTDKDIQFGVKVFRNVQMAHKVESILKPEYPKTVNCSKCNSILEIEESDVTPISYVEHDQRQGDYVATRKIWECPCCKTTNYIK